MVCLHNGIFVVKLGQYMTKIFNLTLIKQSSFATKILLMDTSQHQI
jgi:hypothetical protein